MKVNIYAAKTQLSRLIDQAAGGEEVVITRHGRPVARLVPYEAREGVRKLGLLSGQIHIGPDFDAPLPADLQAGFEGDG